MSRCPRTVLRLVQNRALSTKPTAQRSNLFTVTPNWSLRIERTPSQILRLLLNNDYGVHVDDSSIRLGDSKAPLELQLADNRTFSRFPDPSATDQSLADLKEIPDLQRLRVYLERHGEEFETIRTLSSDTFDTIFSEGYSSQEILVHLNALILKYSSQSPEFASSLHALGLRYAAKSLSITALNYHINGWCESNSGLLPSNDSIAVVENIRNAFHATRYAYTSYDSNALLGLVAGEGSHASSFKYKLMDILQRPGDLTAKLINFMGCLGAKESLLEVWRSLQRSEEQDSSPETVENTYELVLAFLDLDMVVVAQNCLREMSSKRPNHKPLTRTLDRLLLALLNRDAVVTLKDDIIGDLFAARLDELESRLGLKWQPNSSCHSRLGNFAFAVDGDNHVTFGSEDDAIGNLRRLSAEATALATSQSKLQLVVIADLLDELAGCEVPLFSLTTEDDVWQYSWLPERSPIEFTNSSSNVHISDSPSPAYLGLIRARLDRHGQPLPLDSERHLMQFGKLSRRQHNTVKRIERSKLGKPGNWIDTGYILALDRISLDYVLLFIGKNKDIIDPGLPTEAPGTLCQLVTLPKMDLSDGKGYERIVSFRDHESFIPRAKFHLDVDPAFDFGDGKEVMNQGF